MNISCIVSKGDGSDVSLSRDAPIIGSAIGNNLYRLVFYIGYQIGMCSKLLADPI